MVRLVTLIVTLSRAQIKGAMNEVDRPPLHPTACEQIDMALYQVDCLHWPQITAMQGPTFVPANVPVPPRLPQQLLGIIRTYATMLFKTEADQYEPFRADGRYAFWLSKLAERVMARVLDAVDKIDHSNPNMILAYHGVGPHDMRQGLQPLLAELVVHYQWNTPVLDAQVMPAPKPPAPETIPASRTESPAIQSERAALRDSYQSAFPDVKIADICWAAGQSYREWRRWINGDAKAKDGSKPDRSFRHVLTSGKTPEQITGKPRPIKYNA